MINFSAEVNTCSAVEVRASVDGVAAAPGPVQLQWDLNGGADSHSFTFFDKAVGSGSHTVSMQWAGLTSCAQEFMSARSMVITANIR